MEVDRKGAVPPRLSSSPRLHRGGGTRLRPILVHVGRHDVIELKIELKGCDSIGRESKGNERSPVLRGGFHGYPMARHNNTLTPSEMVAEAIGYFRVTG